MKDLPYISTIPALSGSYQTSFHTEEYVLRYWSKFSKVKDYQEGVENHQALILCKGQIRECIRSITLLCAAVTNIGHPPDEFSHLNYLRQLAINHTLPTQGKTPYIHTQSLQHHAIAVLVGFDPMFNNLINLIYAALFAATGHMAALK